MARLRPDVEAVGPEEVPGWADGVLVLVGLLDELVRPAAAPRFRSVEEAATAADEEEAAVEVDGELLPI